MLTAAIIAAVAIALAAKEDARVRKNNARYQDTIDRATELLGDGGAPNRKKR